MSIELSQVDTCFLNSKRFRWPIIITVMKIQECAFIMMPDGSIQLCLNIKHANGMVCRCVYFQSNACCCDFTRAGNYSRYKLNHWCFTNRISSVCTLRCAYVHESRINCSEHNDLCRFQFKNIQWNLMESISFSDASSENNSKKKKKNRI